MKEEPCRRRDGPPHPTSRTGSLATLLQRHPHLLRCRGQHLPPHPQQGAGATGDAASRAPSGLAGASSGPLGRWASSSASPSTFPSLSQRRVLSRTCGPNAISVVTSGEPTYNKSLLWYLIKHSLSWAHCIVLSCELVMLLLTHKTVVNFKVKSASNAHPFTSCPVTEELCLPLSRLAKYKREALFKQQISLLWPISSCCLFL